MSGVHESHHVLVTKLSRLNHMQRDRLCRRYPIHQRVTNAKGFPTSAAIKYRLVSPYLSFCVDVR